MATFTSIDFELATSDYNSVCAVGVVAVENDAIVKEFFSLVKPPANKYMWQTTRVHGIKPKDTAEAPTFQELYPQLTQLLQGKNMVAHNENFDRRVLMQTMKHYGLRYADLALGDRWQCTSLLYQQIGFTRTKLSICCETMGIPLVHHDPLSDARAAALLYMKQEEAKQIIKELQLEEK